LQSLTEFTRRRTARRVAPPEISLNRPTIIN
jgi:hypothetical protein